jgi:uncharacterized membrane protein YGL010W
MKNLTEQLTSYATYHRDRRNIATHFVGIPMIVVALAALLARPLSGAPLALVMLLSVVFYFRLDLRYGLAMTAFMALGAWAGLTLAASSTPLWLASSLGLFVVGWAFQFVGHFFEGKKPAFTDDLVGLLVGPLFIVAEGSFALGLRPELQAEIEESAGPTRVGRVVAA